MNKSKQNGAALLVALVILLVLTLLAISGMQGSVMQERMASAQRDGLIALEVAEAGMREVEGILDALTDLDGFGSEPGLFDTGDAPDVFSADTWSTEADNDLSAEASEVDGMTPRYFVEYKGKVVLDAEGDLPRDLGAYGGSAQTEMDYARIVVMAQGPSGQSRRILESFFVFKPGGLDTGAGE